MQYQFQVQIAYCSMPQSRTEISVGEGFKPSRSKILRYLIV